MINMTIELNRSIAEYSSRKKPSTPEDYKKIRDRIDDPYTLTGMDKLRAVYELRGLKFDGNIFESIMD